MSESLTDRAMEFMMNRILGPLLVWVIMPLLILTIVVGIPALVIKECQGSGRERVCAHQPHMGKCTESVKTYYYDATLKIMMPTTSSCGCVSSHGVTVVQPVPAMR
jgi:hypothetical protein